LSETDSTLVDVAHVDVVESAAETPAPQTPAELDVKPANAAPVGSLFQSLGDESSDSESDSDADPDHNKDNETWANLMLELDTLKVAAGTVKGKKKGKANQVVMETPEMVKIKAKIAKVEKEYMFSRKDAGESP
jgi:ATP-dependent RNA helicase DHX29